MISWLARWWPLLVVLWFALGVLAAFVIGRWIAGDEPVTDQRETP